MPVPVVTLVTVAHVTVFMPAVTFPAIMVPTMVLVTILVTMALVSMTSVLVFPGREYEGDQWGFGAEIMANVFQRRELFIDLVAGLRWENIELDRPDIFALDDAEESFLLPRLGLRLEQRSATSSLFADLMFEGNSESLSGNDPDDLTGVRLVELL